MYKFSICIPIYNNYTFTKNCINNLLKLPNDLFEIILVDNASTDQTKIEIEKLLISNNNLKYIRNDNNMGFGRAVNIAIKNATTNSIMILNNDIKFGEQFKDWFISLIDLVERSPNALIGPTGGYVDPKKDFAFVYETNDSNMFINYMSGWCLMAQKETLDKLKISKDNGPFNEIYFLYHEDTDLSFRANLLNIKFQFISTPLIHIGKQTSKLLNTSKHYLESKGIFLKLWKNKK